MKYLHKKTGRIVTVHIGTDGFARAVGYIPDDVDWKKEKYQRRISEAQAHAVIARKELYVAMDVGASSRSLIHSKELELIP
ncbi:hypothetical protein [Brucella sp. 2280]|uniref:hypothetical protein n=1 Tax=Brucella sp. 2280 TaxID=2592625 RepID=UPI001295C652|nr:hypothetical protein [Brucella sp. 2280]QGA56892.1 hypothetical protein GHC20_07315 [Brucella sp. 2280]